MSKQYNTKLQERLEKFLKDENLSQAKAAPILGISQAALSQYRRSMRRKRNLSEPRLQPGTYRQPFPRKRTS